MQCSFYMLHIFLINHIIKPRLHLPVLFINILELLNKLFGQIENIGQRRFGAPAHKEDGTKIADYSDSHYSILNKSLFNLIMIFLPNKSP